jgi:hypothetical protein
MNFTLQGNLKTYGGAYRQVLWLVSEAAYPEISRLVAQFAQNVPNEHHVFPAKNRSYGGNIRVSGLLMVSDFLAAGREVLQRWPAADLVLIPKMAFDAFFRDLQKTPAFKIPEILGRTTWLVFEKGYKKAYLSFPMTQVVDMPKIREQINSFRKEMKKYFICFDPGDLEESYLLIYAQRAKQAGADFVEVQTVGGKTKLETEQVKQIERDIYSQTYARDFTLIEQSDMIISFIPSLDDGRPAISSGVERELQHAHEAAREVYVIWKAKHRPSIFVTQTATKIFADMQEALNFFKKKGYIAG